MSSKLKAAVIGQQEERERSPYEVFRGQVEKLRPEIGTLVGKDGVDRFVRVCLNAVQANPKVLDADRRSLLLACMKSAQDRLLPDGREAVLNIYKTKVKGVGGRDEWIEMVQYLPMVGGLVKKLYDSGHVTFVDAVAVRERDEFEYHRGDEPRVIHKPYIGEEDPGKVIAAYAIFKLRNGETKREVMSRRDIEIVRTKSKAPDGPMWAEDAFYDQAAIKSVIKRAYKQLPSSIVIERAIAADNEAIGLEGLPAMAQHSDMAAIVDQRLDTAMRDVPPGTAAQKETAAQTRADVPPDHHQSNREPGTPELKVKFLSSFAACEDTEVLAIKRDELTFYDWAKEDLAELDMAYDARLAELEG